MTIQQRTFHLHMISDATGETLVTLAKAVRVQYAQVRAMEHLHPLVRSRRELDRVLKDVEAAPGIVLYTLFNRELADALEQSCKRLNVPSGEASRLDLLPPVRVSCVRSRPSGLTL